MAERRMFAKTIIDSDAFLSLSVDARVLYFSIGICARDKGLVNNIRSIARSHGVNVSAVAELADAGYITQTSDSEYTIVHWYENNGVGETAKKRNTYIYHQWRDEVIEHAMHKCERCGSTVNLNAHHIKHFAQFPMLRYVPENGMCLCEKCHRQLHKKEASDGRREMD